MIYGLEYKDGNLLNILRFQNKKKRLATDWCTGRLIEKELEDAFKGTSQRKIYQMPHRWTIPSMVRGSMSCIEEVILYVGELIEDQSVSTG